MVCNRLNYVCDRHPLFFPPLRGCSQVANGVDRQCLAASPNYGLVAGVELRPVGYNLTTSGRDIGLREVYSDGGP